jgi:hypothetical protein
MKRQLIDRRALILGIVILIVVLLAVALTDVIAGGLVAVGFATANLVLTRSSPPDRHHRAFRLTLSPRSPPAA